MIDKLNELRENTLKAVDNSSSLEEVEKLKVSVIGRKGSLTEVLRSLSTLPIAERKSAGEKANILRGEIESAIEAKIGQIKNKVLSFQLGSEGIDVSLKLSYGFPAGHLHPLRQTLEEISDIFRSLGFTVAVGPEIEADWYNFEALNIPKDHPARDSQDTFYLAGSNKLLRTHTSPVQIHVMEQQKPPVRVIVPGRVYRNEATDASHSAVFHQVEGLAVDEKITFSDLKGTLTLFVHRFFGPHVKVRFRPSHFQFTEPSAEMDIQCIICGGKGCRVCKNTGWLEMVGCGMVHPNVFKAVKYDPEKYTGFAFGLGVERSAMLKYGIDDMRLFYENNFQFLEKF